MIQRIYRWMLMTTLAMGIGMGVASCKDDDKNESSNEQQAEAISQMFRIFFILNS